MIRAGWIAILIYLALSFPLPTISAEKAEHISVQSEIDHGSFTIGDRVNYQFTVEHASDIEILGILITETLQDFEIKSQEDFYLEEQGLIREGKRVELTSFLLGEYVLAPAEIRYRTADGETHELTSNVLYVTVESIDQDGQASEDIAEIKSVVDWGGHKWFWFILILLVIAAVVTGWFWSRRQETLIAGQTPAEFLSPHEEAFIALNRLVDSNLLSQGDYKTYFSIMSEILRRYFERRFEFLALESTTDEVMAHIRSLDLDGKTRNSIRALLEICDLVKFAKHRPAPTDISRYNAQAKEIIELTKQPEPTIAAQANSDQKPLVSQMS